MGFMVGFGVGDMVGFKVGDSVGAGVSFVRFCFNARTVVADASLGTDADVDADESFAEWVVTICSLVLNLRCPRMDDAEATTTKDNVTMSTNKT